MAQGAEAPCLSLSTASRRSSARQLDVGQFGQCVSSLQRHTHVHLDTGTGRIFVLDGAQIFDGETSRMVGREQAVQAAVLIQMEGEDVGFAVLLLDEVVQAVRDQPFSMPLFAFHLGKH